MPRTRTSYPVRAAVAALTAALFAAACTGGTKREATPTAPTAAAPVAAAPKPDPVAAVNAIADRYVALVIDFDPTVTYDTGTPAAVTYAVLREQLDASRGLRVCHQERWSLSHMGGWQVSLAEAAASQPVDTPEAREQAIRRWSSLPGYIDNDTANLREGLATGYAVPKAIVARVIQQLDGALGAKPEEWPFWSPAERSNDDAFKARMRDVIVQVIKPAVQRYRDFLVNEYAPKARAGMALSDLPDGAACYAAQLRNYTTLTRSAQEVYDLGKKTVADNEAGVAQIGQRVFGTRDIKTILAKVEKAKDNHFKSEAELLEFSRGMLERARELSAPLFLELPKQPAIIQPLPDYQRGTGMSAHYIPSGDPNKPGEYRIPLENWKKDTRGSAEITLVHETWPGHHLQMALASSLPARHMVAKLAFNSAYLEGWGRYSERLAEEAGIYNTEYAKISRRIWPARGMVADPGIHMFGWTRQQAVDYFVATGRFDPKTAEALVDRIAVMPGQLTSYDSGGLEIFALREQAERELGDRFDLRQFHARVVEHGVLPLKALRENVETWIAQTKGEAAP
ncbi:MAG TPA: DUF885 domain-containing protein [Tahibacter sp.]|nr:DUF885 domain-containing protein [Tahibacter sp.]